MVKDEERLSQAALIAGSSSDVEASFIRSLLFNIAFWFWTIVMGLIAVPILFGSRLAMVRHAMRWERGIRWLLRVIVGLRHEVRGRSLLPPAPMIVAMKHQSAWDTVMTHLLIDDPAIALKHELTLVPIFGRALLHAGMIRIDRGQGSKAIRSLIEGGKAAAARGSPIVVFPEGTRVEPGEKGSYQAGVAALYRQLGLPVVPVALNSGVFWGRRHFTKRPGTIVVEFLEPIQPGLDKKTFMEELEQRIEAATAKLIDEAKNAKNDGAVPDHP